MISTVKLLTLLLILLTVFKKSRAFCNNEKLYACKEGGITKCVPKTERCDEDCSMNPFPIEKPSCKVGCTPHHKWCEQRGKCVSNKEKCDCGPDKIYCTAKGTYSCENRHGLHESPIFNICPDGSCIGANENCTGIEGDTCQPGTFKCGEECKQNQQLSNFRECESKCISASDMCVISASASSYDMVITIAILICVAMILSIISIFVWYKWDDLTKLYALSQLGKQLNEAYKDKKIRAALDEHLGNQLNEAYTDKKTRSALDEQKYQELTDTIKIKEAQIRKHLLKLNHGERKIELIPKKDVRNLKEDVRKFISDGCTLSKNNELLDITHTETHNTNRWILVGHDKNAGCYCKVCIIAGVSNQFTQHPGAPPTETSKKAHFYASSQYYNQKDHCTASSQYSSQISSDQTQDQETSSKAETSTNYENNKINSHFYAEHIIENTKKFVDDIIKSRSIYSLILYEQKNVIAVILKTIQIIEKQDDKQKDVQDIHIPLALLEVNQDSHPISLIDEIRKKLSTQNISLKQISSISAVHVNGRLPPMSANLSKTFCGLPEAECIDLHLIQLVQRLVYQRDHENFSDPHLVILHRVINALIYVLRHSPQGFDILSKMQMQNKEPIITQEMFNCLRYTSLKAVIFFIRSSSKSIKETLIKISEDNATDEDKQRVDGLIKSMENFSFKAAILLQDVVLDAHEEGAFHLRDINSNCSHIWDTFQKKIKSLEKIVDKKQSNYTATDEDNELISKEFDCLKIEENLMNVNAEYVTNCLDIGTNFVNDEARSKRRLSTWFEPSNNDEINTLIKTSKGKPTQREINLFNMFRNTFLGSAINSLKSSFSKESTKIIKALSIMLNPKMQDVYVEPMKDLRDKFSTINTNRSTVRDIDKLKRRFNHMGTRRFAAQIVANHSKDVPNLGFLAEVYLNLNVDSRHLQKLFLEIDLIVSTTTPELDLGDKANKILITAMKPALQLETDIEKNANNHQGRTLNAMERIEQAKEVLEETVPSLQFTIL